MVKIAVKILPGIAEQLDTISRVNSRAYSIGKLVTTEDEIPTTDQPTSRAKTNHWETIPEGIAYDTNLHAVASESIDIMEAIRIRQRRLAELQKTVRLLAELNANHGYKLYEGKSR